MPRVSKYYLSQDQLEDVTSHFLYLISSLSNTKEIEGFLTEFLTKEEKVMLAKRLVLCMMLKKGYSTPAIQSALNLSHETIRNYSHQIASKSEGFQKIVERLIARQESHLFWEKIEKLLKPLELALASKHNMKARAKFASGDWISE